MNEGSQNPVDLEKGGKIRGKNRNLNAKWEGERKKGKMAEQRSHEAIMKEDGDINNMMKEECRNQLESGENDLMRDLEISDSGSSETEEVVTGKGSRKTRGRLSDSSNPRTPKQINKKPREHSPEAEDRDEMEKLVDRIFSSTTFQDAIGRKIDRCFDRPQDRLERRVDKLERGNEDVKEGVRELNIKLDSMEINKMNERLEQVEKENEKLTKEIETLKERLEEDKRRGAERENIPEEEKQER